MDFELCVQTLKKLKEGRNVEIPIYDFATHSRLDETQRMYGANVVIFEGIMTFHYPELRDLMDMKIFVDTDADIRLARRRMMGCHYFGVKGRGGGLIGVNI
jgi:uridine kinase